MLWNVTTTSTSSTTGMSRRRRTAKNDNTPGYQAKRAELMLIAAEIFSDKGYEGATLNDIAAAFGTDRASIYYYFASKKELFQALFHDIVGDVLEENLTVAEDTAAAEGTARSKISRLIDQQLTSYEKNYPYVSLYIQEDMAKLRMDKTPWAREMLRKTKQFESIVLDVLNEGVENGEIRADIPVPLMARALFGMVNWTHRWLKPGARKVDAAQTIEAFCKLFFEGAAT
jgi:AcrR family transcriptional regulator